MSTTWQPADTAPKDGTEFLGYWDNDGSRSMVYAALLDAPPRTTAAGALTHDTRDDEPASSR
jgi:hypothetical protein